MTIICQPQIPLSFLRDTMPRLCGANVARGQGMHTNINYVYEENIIPLNDENNT